MIVLDTNVVSELMHHRGSSVVRQWVAAQPITNLFTNSAIRSDSFANTASTAAIRSSKETLVAIGFSPNESFLSEG
jgi:predicted nucleic acid-binding protein